MKKILATLLLALSLTLNPAQLAWADSSDSFNVFEILEVDTGEDTTEFSENIREEAGKKSTSPAGAIILRAINILSLLVGTFAFILILIGGFMMITAGGDESKVDRAKNLLTQAVTGTFLAFMAYFIVVFIQSFFY